MGKSGRGYAVEGTKLTPVDYAVLSIGPGPTGTG
jgi:hypothetical protein